MSRTVLATALVAATATLSGCSVIMSMVKGGDDAPGRGIRPGNLVKVEPDPGLPRVAPTKATWCQVVDPETVDNLDGSRITSAMNNMLERGFWDHHAKWAAQTLCAPIDDDGVRQQTAYFLQAWVNLTGASAADIQALMLYFAHDERYAEGLQQACSKLAVSDEASSHDKHTAKAMAEFFGCDGFPAWLFPKTDTPAARLVEDAPTPPSEILHAYAQLQCAGAVVNDEPHNLVPYGACRLDARPIDAKKLDRELKAYGELAQIMGRLSIGRAAIERKRAEEIATATAKKDPAWQTVLFDAPSKAWKAWHESYQPHARIFQDAAAFEAIVDGPSRKAVEGCLAPAWKNLRDYVKAQKPRTAADIQRALGTYVGVRALQHVAGCARATGADEVAEMMAKATSPSPSYHGPRAAAAVAQAEAVTEIRRDRDKFLSDGYGARERRSWESLSMDGHKEIAAVQVKAVEKSGPNLVVSFVPRRWKEDSQDCESTGKLLGYEDSGRPYFEQRCGKVYKVERSETARTMTFRAEVGAAIKPGVFVVASGDFPVEVWSSKDKKKLLAYLGIPL